MLRCPCLRVQIAKNTWKKPLGRAQSLEFASKSPQSARVVVMMVAAKAMMAGPLSVPALMILQRLSRQDHDVNGQGTVLMFLLFLPGWCCLLESGADLMWWPTTFARWSRVFYTSSWSTWSRVFQARWSVCQWWKSRRESSQFGGGPLLLDPRSP